MPAVVFAKFVQLIHHNIRKREEFIMSENKKKTVAFVPVKLNNERIPGKNTKPFDGGEPLITYILNTLKTVDKIDAIYVYCSDEEVVKYLPDGVGFLKRSPELDKNTTLILEVLEAFANDVEADTYVLAHATAPFISRQTIEKAIDAVNGGEYDSALSVIPCHDFLWSENEPLNYDKNSVPRTQDLKKIYVETTGLYVYGRELILNKHIRTGDKPYFVEVTNEEAIDINEKIDFVLANAVYQQRVKEGRA